MNKPKISIILPVYNAKSYVSRMIDSIMVQTLTDWELVIVDDGSVDGSDILVDEYATKDFRIKVFHKKNGGVSTARQLGVDNVNGKYVIHFDADDWVEPTLLYEMYVKAENESADIVIADFYVVNGNGYEEYKHQMIDSLKPSDVLYRIHTGGAFGALWNKLVRRDLYIRYNACFFEGINYCEDVLLFTQILCHSEVNVSYIRKGYYHYLVHSDSITHNVSYSVFEGIKKYTIKLCEFLPEEERFVKIREALPLGVFQTGFMNCFYTDSEIKSEFTKVKHLAYKTKSIRWFIGYFCISIGFYKIAHKLIRY